MKADARVWMSGNKNGNMEFFLQNWSQWEKMDINSFVLFWFFANPKSRMRTF